MILHQVEAVEKLQADQVQADQAEVVVVVHYARSLTLRSSD
jgi:hypothetical protein